MDKFNLLWIAMSVLKWFTEKNLFVILSYNNQDEVLTRCSMHLATVLYKEPFILGFLKGFSTFVSIFSLLRVLCPWFFYWRIALSSDNVLDMQNTPRRWFLAELEGYEAKVFTKKVVNIRLLTSSKSDWSSTFKDLSTFAQIFSLLRVARTWFFYWRIALSSENVSKM